MSSERLYLVDRYDHPIGSAARTDAIASRSWRRAGGGLAIDIRRGLVLCHQRTATKDERPGVWVATFGGKTLAGETSEGSARRELEEEFGITKGHLRFQLRYKSVRRRQFEYVFYFFTDAVGATIECDPNEVAAFSWMPIEQAIDAIKANKNKWYRYGYELPMLAGILTHLTKSRRRVSFARERSFRGS